MFELNGSTTTLDELKSFAEQNNIDFDTYMSDMKASGMVEVKTDPEALAMKSFYEAGIPGFAKTGMTIVNVVKALPQLLVDSKERKKTAEYMANRIDNIPETLQSALYSAQSAAVDLYTADIDGIPGYGNEKQQELREQAEKKIISNYDKIEKLDFKETGKGIVAGATSGSPSDLLAGVFGAGISMAETAIPAALTFGASLPVQVAAPMYTAYNEAKAKQIYGDDPEALQKLVNNNQTEIAIPLALGALATGLEYVGLKGVTKYIQSVPGKGTQLAKLLWTGSGEGFTEVAQLGTEKLNEGLGLGKSVKEASIDSWDAMTSDEGLEMWLNGFLGAGQMSVASRAVNRALRSSNASVKELNEKIDNLSSLNNKKYNTRNKEVKESIDLDIKDAEQDLKNYIQEKRKISEILNEDQKQSLINIINEKDNIKSKAESLKKQLNDGVISSGEFGYAIRGLNNQDKKLSENIELINETAKEQLLQTSLEATKEKSEKLGLEQIELSQEEFTKQFPDDADSDGAIVGDKIYINRDVARQTGAIGVGSHELLHGIIGNSYKKLGTEDKIKLNTEFLNLLGTKEKQAILSRLANSYGITGSKVFETEELFTAFSDAIVDGGLSFNEGVFGKIKNTIHKVLNKFGYQKEFKSARQTYNFLKDYSKNIKEGKLTERAAEFAKQDPGVKGKRISKTASDKVQRIYEEVGATGAFDIINEFKPIVSKIVEKRSEAPGFDRQLLTDEIETGKRGILDLIGEYDPKSGVPLAAFINKFLPARAIEASRRVLGEEFTQDVTEAKGVMAEEVAEVEVEAKPKKKKIILSDRLGVKNKVDKAISKKLPDLDIENLNFKNLKDQTPEITGELFGISPKKLISLANITKKELQSAQMFINKNADVLIAMLPEGATTGGTATGVPGSLLKAFYTKTDRAKAAKTGSKAGLAIQEKNDINKKDFLETFGIIDGKPDRTDRNTSARVLALANLTGKMMSNQAVREVLSKNVTENNAKSMLRLSDGKSAVMFSKSMSKEKDMPYILDYLKEVDPKITEDKSYQILGNYANLTDQEFKKQFPIYFNGIIDYVENMAQFVADGGKEARQFTKAIKGVDFGNEKLNDYLKNGFWTLSDAKFKKDKKAMAWFLKTSYDLADQIVLPENATDGNRRLLLGFFAGHYNIVGSDMAKVGSTLKQGIISRLNKKGKSVLSKKTLDRWKNFDFENLKSSYASTFYTGLKKIYNANSLKEQVAIAKEYFTGKESSLQVEFYDLWNTTLEEWLHSSEVGSKEFNSKADYVLKLKKANAAIGTTGERIMAPGGYVYLPGSILDATIKFEHLKSSSQQSKESALLVINNEWQKNGKENVKDYKGIYGPLELFNMIDAATGKVNDKNIFRLAGNLEAAKKIYKIDDFKTTLYDDIVSNLTKDQLGTLERANNTREVNRLNKGIMFSRSSKNEPKGITVLDFDDTLATTESLVKYTAPNGETGTLNAEQFASTYQDLLDQGYTFDFSDFNKVVKGKLAPLFNKAIKLQGKFGPENMFVLTARPPQAQKAIFDFLKANGLNIPLENITGLGNSTSEAKALWIADKVGEGYNDFYFADDALQNVQAVKNMLDQFDVKSKVQQAKVKFSKTLNTEFNDILQDVTGIESKKRFSAIKARKRGASKGKFRFFIPPSHEDFVGLLYNFIGKGKLGNEHRDFFEQALVRPLNRAYRELNTARQSIANDYKNLNKQFPDVKKKLTNKTPDGDFTYQDAIRVYLWDKHGYEVPGLSETDQKELVDLIKSDGELQAYADAINVISKRDDYVTPTETWEAGDLRTDLDDATGRIGREQFFTEFFENADIIFSTENMNKIEAAYGADMVDALKDMLYRTKTGRNRPSGQNKQVNQFMNWLNGSVAATMFFNIRSAVLQQMSLVNFINFSDNNILSAAKAFANQKQYWADWAMLFNSDFMKQRRGGIMTDVNGAELAASVRDAKNPAQAVIKKLLEIGFLPTQIGDNIAIATGGAPFYRNRVDSYLKEGLSKKEAESKAFVDFQVLAEATQQSARPDMVSQQQASPLGKVILAFQNVTSQFNRLGKKAFLDIKNRRITPGNKTQAQSDISNMSRIAYYLAIQNLIFYSLQSALFMAMFDDDEDDEKYLKKKERMINGSIDSVLRGSGVSGAVVSTLKNMAIKRLDKKDKKSSSNIYDVLAEGLQVSPPLGIKARKLLKAERDLVWKKKVIEEMDTFDIENPMWSAYTSYIEGLANIPLNRLYNKTLNMRESLDNQNSAFERLLMFSGWSKWNLGIEDVKKSKGKQKFGIKKREVKQRTIKKR
jgi:hypothetical protein